MDEMTRRRFLAATAAMLGAGLAYGAAPAARSTKPWRERRDVYPEGVASGDPTADSVILWTRRPPGDAQARVLTVEVAEDAAFARIVARGNAEVSEAADWTCRFLAAGLRPAREYWYRFTDEHGFGSRVGRTLTAPASDDSRPVRFAFVSCQSVTEGACNAYRRMIFEGKRRRPEDRLGFVLHLSDFIYEVVWYPEDMPDGRYARRIRDVYRLPHGEKIRNFHVPVSVEDYRATYRAYLHDSDLQDARAHWPFVCVWDNHEFSWQGWQSQQVFGAETRPVQTKNVAANQAWFEYQPARVARPGSPSVDRFIAPRVDDAPIERFDEFRLGLEPNNIVAIESPRIHRTLHWGANVDLILTDNHSYRAKPPDLGPFTRAFGVGNETPIGKMYGINIGCLDGATEEELSKIPVTYVDGMNDRQGPPEFFAHL